MAVAILTPSSTIQQNMKSGSIQNQLTRSLERILEEANLSGELKLSGRKLKDFPKGAGKYDLRDTVIADLSRNRFCELPDDVTSFVFLERLYAYHNAIKSVPETVRSLRSLSYIDLRNNQLTTLPRELCFLPIEVLLVANNRLATLPEELGRMEQLTELDASCNQITHLPARMGDLKNLRALSLRSNQLVYIPRDVTCLQLVSFDVSCNRISTLPVELRLMTSLVDLELSNNPLTSPPASLCVRGLVHVFKFLDIVATKDDKTKSGSPLYDGNGTLRRNVPRNNLLEHQNKNRRPQTDSGYCEGSGLDKRWSQEVQNQEYSAKWSPTPLHVRTDYNNVNVLYAGQSKSGGSTPSTMSPGGNGLGATTPMSTSNSSNGNNVHLNGTQSADVSPEGDVTPDTALRIDEKFKSLGNIQTYREYKEALRQQRCQDNTSIYRSKDSTPISGAPDGGTPTLTDSGNFSKTSSPSSSIYAKAGSAPISPFHQNPGKLNNLNGTTNGFGANNNYEKPPSVGASPVRTVSPFDESLPPTGTKRPVQKVIPSRNVANGNHSMVNGKAAPTNGADAGGGGGGYIKPSSPIRAMSGILTHNSVPDKQGGVVQKPLTATVGYVNNSRPGQKLNKTVSWNRDVPSDKMSFTMRREIDKQREESELLKQLRMIIETRLKMQLPEDMAPSLMDGVVLCHLANHVKPRSVGSIHVPSPAVPKLTMARCRRNVDNFLKACREIGVDEEFLCSCEDVVPDDFVDTDGDDDDQTPASVPPNPERFTRTLEAFVVCLADPNPTPATNTKPTVNKQQSAMVFPKPKEIVDDNYDNYFKKCGIYFQKRAALTENNNGGEHTGTNGKVETLDDDDVDGMVDMGPAEEEAGDNPINNNYIKAAPLAPGKRKIPNTLDLKRNGKVTGNRKRRYLSRYANLKLYDSLVEEDCEYDSDVGFFKCKPDTDGSASTSSNENIRHEANDLSSPRRESTTNELNIMGNDDTVHRKIVSKRIEFFESGVQGGGGGAQVTVLEERETVQEKLINVEAKLDDKNLSTILCLGTFIMALILLIVFPLPN